MTQIVYAHTTHMYFFFSLKDMLDWSDFIDSTNMSVLPPVPGAKSWGCTS